MIDKLLKQAHDIQAKLDRLEEIEAVFLSMQSKTKTYPAGQPVAGVKSHPGEAVVPLDSYEALKKLIEAKP